MDDNQNTANSQQNVNNTVDNAMKDFDISKLQSVGYDKVQELAAQFLASDDPEAHVIGQELKNIDPKIFELSPSEEELKKLHNMLIEQGKTKEDADMFGIHMLQLAVESTTQQIIGAMNEKSLKEWEELQGHSPNILQQMYLLDQTSRMLLKKSYDDIYDQSLKKAIDLATRLMDTKAKSTKLVENITDEQAKIIQTAFDNNQYEIAIQLIYNFSEENGK